MKRIVACALVLIILLCSLAGCGSKKLLAEKEFNIYKNGELFINPNDMRGSNVNFMESDEETYRGLKLNDSITKVKELYGNEKIYVLDENNTFNETTVNELINSKKREEYTIRFEKFYNNGKVCNIKQYLNFPIGAEYAEKLLTISINDYAVSNIRVFYGEFVVTEETKRSMEKLKCY